MKKAIILLYAGPGTLLVGFIFLILTLSCSSGEEGKVVFKKATLSSIDELIDSIRIVRLDQDSVLIGPNPLIMLKDSSIYVADRRLQYVVFRFNLSGKFLNVIGQPGQGPGEYPGGITDVFISDKEDDVYILSWPAAVYRYSKTGFFKEHVDNYQLGAQSFIKQDTFFWIRSVETVEGCPNLFKMDARLSIIDTICFITSNLFSRSVDSFISHSFRNIKQKTYFWRWPNPIVYELSADGMKDSVCFHFEPSNYVSSQDLELLDLRQLTQARMPQLINGYYENSKYIITEFQCSRGRKSNAEQHVIYAIKNLKTEKWDWVDYKLGRDSDKYWQHQLFDLTEDGTLVYYIPGWKVLESYGKVKSLVKNPEMLDVVNEEGDMYLFFCYLQ